MEGREDREDREGYETQETSRPDGQTARRQENLSPYHLMTSSPFQS
jgi:hypothetical protein